MTRAEARGWVYFFALPHGPIKIGFTRNVGARLSCFGRAGHEARYLGAVYADMAYEHTLHARFRAFAVPGEREQYTAAPELLAFIKALPALTADELMNGVLDDRAPAMRGNQGVRCDCEGGAA